MTLRTPCDVANGGKMKLLRMWGILFAVGLLGFISVSIWFFVDVLPAMEIHTAIRREDTTKIAEILDKSPERLTARNNIGQTPLQAAAYAGKTKSLRVLIQRGADVNAPWRCANYPEIWYNPLHVTAINGHVEAAEVLIGAGTDVNWKSNQGETPLDVAQKNGHRRLIDLFQKHGARSGKGQ